MVKAKWESYWSPDLEVYGTHQRPLVCCLPTPDLSARPGLLFPPTTPPPHMRDQGKNLHLHYQLNAFCIAINGKVLSLYIFSFCQ